MTALLRWLAPRLSSPRLPRALLLVGLSLCAPALWVGYQADDWQQLLLWRGQGFLGPQASAPMEMFTFASPPVNDHLRALGLHPWWAPPGLSTRLWRPLTALTHGLDEALAPGSSALAHAHSLLWLGALLLLTHRLYQRVHGAGAPVAGLAALLYAVDDAHGVPVGWIANRNALTTGALGVAVVLLFVAGRPAPPRPPSLRARWAGPAAVAVALLAGEAAIAALAWIVAWLLCMEDTPWRARAAALLPYAAITLAWRALYHHLGYHTAGSGLYLDPASDPRAFATALPTRAALLLGDQLFKLPSILHPFLRAPGQALLLTATLAALALLARGAWPLLRDRREARFWALGALGALLPVSSTFPSERLLTFVGVGAAALIAMGIEATVWRGARLSRAGLLFVTLHLALSPLLLPLHAYGPRSVADVFFNACDDAIPDDPSVTGETVVFVTANELCTAHVLPRRAATGRPAPQAVRILASALYDVEVLGVDPYTLDLSLPEGMQSRDADTLFRARSAPLPIGATVALPGLTLTVRSHNARGLVDGVRARFDAPLRSPALRWFATQDLRAVPFTPPAPGERVWLARTL